MAQNNTGQNIGQITGGGCSDCVCREPAPFNGSLSSNLCLTLNNNAFNDIATAAGTSSKLTDPWGNPYVIDQNEGEGGGCNGNVDMMRSAGPDRLLGSADDISATVPSISCSSATPARVVDGSGN